MQMDGLLISRRRTGHYLVFWSLSLRIHAPMPLTRQTS